MVWKPKTMEYTVFTNTVYGFEPDSQDQNSPDQDSQDQDGQKPKPFKKTVITVILYGFEAKNMKKYSFYCYFLWFGIQQPNSRQLLLLFLMVCFIIGLLTVATLLST